MSGLVGGVRRPVVRYHGGKWRLAPWIISHFPPHHVYVEPFAGGASVLLRKGRSYAEVYNDLDGEIVNLFRVLRDHTKDLELVARLTPYAREEFDLAYQPDGDPLEQARRTLFRAAAGFGSVAASGRKTGFRSNVTRSGTTPATDWSTMPEIIAQVGERLSGVVIENRPALDVVAQYDGTETLFYVDPPYLHNTRTTTAKWDRIYRHEMSDADHTELARGLTNATGMVVVSGYPSELYDRLYEGWTRKSKDTTAGAAAPRTECVWINDAALEVTQTSLALAPPTKATRTQTSTED